MAGSEPSGKLFHMPRTKTFSIKMADLPNMVDAIFAGNHDDPGWVEMNANDKGAARHTILTNPIARNVETPVRGVAGPETAYSNPQARACSRARAA